MSVSLNNNTPVDHTHYDPLEILPEEVSSHILSFLDGGSLTKAREVNKETWQRIADDNILWGSIARRMIAIIGKELSDKIIVSLPKIYNNKTQNKEVDQRLFVKTVCDTIFPQMIPKKSDENAFQGSENNKTSSIKTASKRPFLDPVEKSREFLIDRNLLIIAQSLRSHSGCNSLNSFIQESNVEELSQKELHQKANEVRNWMSSHTEAMQTITSLDLSDKNMKGPLPKEICTLANLRELDISHNQITSIPTEIGTLVNLQRLLLGNNQITSIPQEIGNLVKLQLLNLSNNQITSILKEIGTLVYLRELDISHNQIRSIPKEIGTLVNLFSLNVSYNQIRSIPKEIGTLINLLTLHLENNQITSIPKEICTLVNLQNLDLSNNLITSIPKEICTLVNLPFLNLSNNQIATIPKEIGTLINLKDLGLSNNLITSIPIEISRLKGLWLFSIANNPLKTLPENIEKMPQSLRTKIRACFEAHQKSLLALEG